MNSIASTPPEVRERLWAGWNKEERRCVYCVSNKSFQKEQRRWKVQYADRSQQSTSSCASSGWQHDLTQDGDIHPNPGPVQVVADDVITPEEIRKHRFRDGIPKTQHVHFFPVAQSGARGQSPRPDQPRLPEPHREIGVFRL